MMESKEWVSEEERARHAGHDRIIGLVTWLVAAMVLLDVNLIAGELDGSLGLNLLCLALLCYRLVAGRLPLGGQVKTSLDMVALLSFAVTVCWFTGKTASPFVAVVYMVLMATSLTLGKRITYLMAALAVVSYSLLASAQSPFFAAQLAGRCLELLPFLLIAHLGALLSGEAETARAQVQRLSLTDDLTELNNMRSFEALALQQERLNKRHRTPFAICMLDADDLKRVNDRYGHLAGTEMIKWSAQIIRQNIRDCDIAARFGGDEFIVMYNGHHKRQILPAVERIVRAMAENPFTFEGKQIGFTVSAGVASYPLDGPDLRSVIAKADQAMYLSKHLGKNRATLSPAEAGQVDELFPNATGKGRIILPRRP